MSPPNAIDGSETCILSRCSWKNALLMDYMNSAMVWVGRMDLFVHSSPYISSELLQIL